MHAHFTLFGGSANPALARAVAAELGAPLGACSVERFPDGELTVRIQQSVRGQEVYLLQPTSPPVNDHLVELLAWVDACRRAAAARITAVIPYFGYARADKRHRRREPITASMVARLLEAVGVGQVVTVDLHTIQAEGFFGIPVDTLTAVSTLCEAVQPVLPADAVVVSPDAGRVPLATEYAERLRLPLAVLHKRRDSARETEVTHLVGEVRGKCCLLVDDMISTGGTITKSGAALREAGARELLVTATHGLLLADARERLRKAGVRRLWVTDSVPVAGDDLVEVVSIAPLLARALRQLTHGGSLRDLG